MKRHQENYPVYVHNVTHRKYNLLNENPTGGICPSELLVKEATEDSKTGCYNYLGCLYP